MTKRPIQIADLELADRLLVPIIDLVNDEFEAGTCPLKIAVLFQTLALAASRYDVSGDDDFVSLLTQEMRQAAKELRS